jgi:hypothetical protein
MTLVSATKMTNGTSIPQKRPKATMSATAHLAWHDERPDAGVGEPSTAPEFLHACPVGYGVPSI